MMRTTWRADGTMTDRTATSSRKLHTRHWRRKKISARYSNRQKKWRREHHLNLKIYIRQGPRRSHTSRILWLLHYGWWLSMRQSSQKRAPPLPLLTLRKVEINGKSISTVLPYGRTKPYGFSHDFTLYVTALLFESDSVSRKLLEKDSKPFCDDVLVPK